MGRVSWGDGAVRGGVRWVERGEVEWCGVVLGETIPQVHLMELPNALDPVLM